MREIEVSKIKDAVSILCIKANKTLPCDVVNRINECEKNEKNPLAKSVLADIKANIECAKECDLPICQDTGMAVVFLEIGQDVHLTGGNLTDAVNAGVSDGYIKGLLRKSVVKDPILRGNTEDNTPAVLHTVITDGDKVKITVAPKGFGSENMSGIKMLSPADSRQGVIHAVTDIVKKAAGKPCPPIIVGVGIGGDFEQCAYLAKTALLRDIDIKNENEYYAELEKELLERINALNIGPQGFGGYTTALAVNINTAPTHIAGLPVAVCIGCHVSRHAVAVI